MSAFNTVSYKLTNPETGESMNVKLQFKYGDTWQHDYKIGDVLKWGGNHIGHKNAKRVVVDACLDGPSPFPSAAEDYEVHVVNGRIARVVPSTGRFDFVTAKESFIILEDG